MGFLYLKYFFLLFRTHVSLKSPVKLADIFDVSLDYLLGRTKEKHNLNLKNVHDRNFIMNLVEMMENHYKKTK